ncbi:hypothetical protein Y1Q_0003896 [Alligator mississippiensis]|uniref:Reverse transcriptase domain-containing protein n=1 Tax=Alligator mississippiensis TaxID=8496 RepID=A0A151MNP5_ALLMI|nr:hypothetical protein Y1Q_0003896 [Alligator mississippiensis]
MVKHLGKIPAEVYKAGGLHMALKLTELFQSIWTQSTITQKYMDGMLAHVVDDRESSELFLVTNEVNQGCVLAPTLFHMMFSAMLTDPFHDCDTGIDISDQTDSKFFNLERLQTKRKLQEETVHDLLFADDGSLNAKSKSDTQQIMDHFSLACDNFGLAINTKTTEVMHQPAPGKPYVEPTITVNGLAKPSRQWTSSPISAVGCHMQFTLMIKAMPEMLKQVWPSVDYVQMCGSTEASVNKQNWRSTKPLCCPS